MRRLSGLAIALLLTFPVGACTDQSAPPGPSTTVTSLPPVTGVGGRPADYAEISTVIQRGVQAADEQNPQKHVDAQCAQTRPGLEDEHLDQEFMKDIYRGIHVVSISDIRVDGKQATAEVVIKDAESEFPMDLSLIREDGQWLVC